MLLPQAKAQVALIWQRRFKKMCSSSTPVTLTPRVVAFLSIVLVEQDLFLPEGSRRGVTELVFSH